MDNISIIIHSHSFEGIVDCVSSAKLLANNILLIGEETRENVKKELADLGVKIIPFQNSGIVETAREFGIKQAQTDWALLLDADERITNSLVQEIKSVISLKLVDYYQIPRKEILFHKHWLKHGGWWPNYQTRLIKTSSFISWPKHIHSTPKIQGEMGKLKSPLLHYSQNDFEKIVARTITFEDKESDLLFKAKRQASTLIFFRKFAAELFRRLIGKIGFLDGSLGIIESIYQAFSKTITYLFLYEKNLPSGRQGRSL